MQLSSVCCAGAAAADSLLCASLLRLSVCQPPAEAAAAALAARVSADGDDGDDIGADLDGIIPPPRLRIFFSFCFFFNFFFFLNRHPSLLFFVAIS